jgi:hypothetical protein
LQLKDNIQAVREAWMQLSSPKASIMPFAFTTGWEKQEARSKVDKYTCAT